MSSNEEFVKISAYIYKYQKELLDKLANALGKISFASALRIVLKHHFKEEIKNDNRKRI